MITDDTIVAISSAVGPAARMIVRLSGPASFSIASTFTSEPITALGGSAVRARLHLDSGTDVEDAFPSLAGPLAGRSGGQERPASGPAKLGLAGERTTSTKLDFPATLYCFRAPHSATGEDVIEIHLPGNPLLARMLLDAATNAGARPAEPGEFTARSYFNGRLDLSAAEGVGAVIAAQSDREAVAARRLLSGELSRRLAPTIDLVAQTLALVEAEIDFAGEEISVLDLPQTRERIARIIMHLEKLLAESSRFGALSHEPTIVLVGRPNAGKSTLLNALAADARAIVSPIAGTTRDVLSACTMLRRGRVTLLDAAGLEDLNGRSEVGEQMHAASMQAINTADVVVLVREVGDRSPEISLPAGPHLRIRSKADLDCGTFDELCISAHTGFGFEDLRERLDELAFGACAAGSSLALNARHVECVENATSSLKRAASTEASELIALELREALDSLGSILGSVTPDDVLGRIFSAFCIGK